jgi:hypothetical protein
MAWGSNAWGVSGFGSSVSPAHSFLSSTVAGYRAHFEKARGSVLGEFLFSYFCCEVLSKAILATRFGIFPLSVTDRPGLHRKADRADKLQLIQKLDRRSLDPALAHFGVTGDRELIERLFATSSTSKTNASARVLRNLIAHSLDNTALNMIQSRRKELMADLTLFIGNVEACVRDGRFDKR